ncbi:MAG: hypothetical protein ABI977_22045 [Acidobacteriota bacterium]
MDLGKFKLAATSDEGRWLHLRDPFENQLLFADGPDGKPDENKPMRICLYGKDSKAFKRAERDLLTKSLSKAQGRNKADVTAESAIAQGIGILIAATKTWENLIVDGVEVPFSENQCAAIYSARDWGWLKEQVDDFVGNRANFDPNAEPTQESSLDPHAYLGQVGGNSESGPTGSLAHEE